MALLHDSLISHYCLSKLEGVKRGKIKILIAMVHTRTSTHSLSDDLIALMSKIYEHSRNWFLRATCSWLHWNTIVKYHMKHWSGQINEPESDWALSVKLSTEQLAQVRGNKLNNSNRIKGKCSRIISSYSKKGRKIKQQILNFTLVEAEKVQI